jgi:16S rRNA (cytosine1402-N4)-methyltransferase
MLCPWSLRPNAKLTVMIENAHTSVMLETSMQMLNVSSGKKTWIDATAGAGGHLREIIRRAGSDATIIGIDQDKFSLDKLSNAFAANQPAVANFHLAHANFSELEEVLTTYGINTIDGGILADLGVSSMQLDNPERGFSFGKEGPLDMRMDPTAITSAEVLINTLPEKELADIIYKYGEERLSRQIARRIVESRPIKTTTQLASVVSPVVLRQRRGSKNRDESHPATRTFQALRIAVNNELQHIENFLRTAIQLLAPGGRLVVITFHSLEDRIVKQIFREAASTCVCPPKLPICMCQKKQELKILTPKPLLPDSQEILANPRSRSAKLRAGERIP